MCEKMSLGSFTNVIFNICLKSYIYYVCMYKNDLALNNLQWLIYHKTKRNNTRWAYILPLHNIGILKRH